MPLLRHKELPTLSASPYASGGTLSVLTALEKGGLSQILSLRGGSSKTRFALSCLRAYLGFSYGPPPLSIWISDEGLLYPPVLSSYWPLSRFVLVKASSAKEVWTAGLEAVQSGLFDWVCLKASRGCEAAHLRKLQIQSERTESRVLLLPRQKLPHWPLKLSIEAEPKEVAYV